ncbi:MAG TPA: methionyl-tRNA formyltransferase [Flavobacteriaceae bacterium]|nr:methionyl-tRNA formyltransferase [Flavobacteriaceae bacterium]
MKDLRIVFMGTPEFAVASLEKIIANGFSVVGVVTAPDKPAGRGRKLNQSAVKKFALEKGIPVLQPVNLKSPEFYEELKSLKANVQVVVAFRMLPKAIWQMPELGTFNLHASLLPQYRGAAPINWAIVNGEKTTGVSTFFIDEKIDTGEIILQQETKIEPNENAGELHDKLMELGGDLVVKTLSLLRNGNVQTFRQPTENLKDAPKLTAENTKIDWNEPAKTIYDKIRGLSPYPTAWCFLEHGKEEVRVKIQKASIKMEAHELPVGEIVQIEKSLKVAVKGGFVVLEEIQLPGKRKMGVKELLNGFSLKENPRMR